MPQQFTYPEQGWSTGEMRKTAKLPVLTDPGYPARELMGQKKKKETKAAQADPTQKAGDSPWDAPGWTVTERKKPTQMTDDELRAYYKQSFTEDFPAELHGSDREFKLYTEELKAHRERESMYGMSPKELRERGVLPSGSKSQERMPQGPQGIW